MTHPRKSILHICHVEDDPDIREIVALSLQMNDGYTLTQYASGQALLNAVPQAPPDVLLLDQMMPGLSGLDTLLRLRSDVSYANVPAIFMTAKAEREIKTLITGEPRVAVITKPINPLALPQQITQLVETLA